LKLKFTKFDLDRGSLQCFPKPRGLLLRDRQERGEDIGEGRGGEGRGKEG